MPSIALATFMFAASLSGVAHDNPGGFESPEKAFTAYLTGAVSGDFDLMLSSLTPKGKAYHIGLAVVSVPYLFGKKEMEKIFADHGIDRSLGDGADKGDADERAMEMAIVDAMLKVKNPARLMRLLKDRTK